MFQKRVQTAICSIAIVLILCTSAFAQGRIGTVQGIVKDPNGAVVPNAKVTITQSVTGYNQTAQTDDDGAFKLVNIPFNTYTVRAEAAGFQTVEQSIDLESGIPLNVDLAVTVAGTAETVTVTTSSAEIEPDRTSSDTDIIQTILERPVGAS
ncbi:MAG TPA: carboxypeptidase-like regulatory domain-containing protein, partial [Pyrinomonadaceae bacterium]|nr:carboxypeptidase-like regulatory domain-containing protein [Pyrinomonadaceae bacterium]